MMRPTILLDADGVLVDFLRSFLEIANGISGLHVTHDDIVQWDVFKAYPEEFHSAMNAAMEAEGFCINMQPILGSVSAVQKLRELGDVVIVTSPWASRTWAWERTRWLIHHMNFKSKDVIHASAKHHVHGAVIIDDKYDTLVEWKRHHPGGAAILWHAPYNASISKDPNIWRAKGWDEVIALVKAALHGQGVLT
jgi:5'(3')-deoxyribonucleotidase